MNIQQKFLTTKSMILVDLCTPLQKIDRKSQHIEMRNDDGNFS